MGNAAGSLSAFFVSQASADRKLKKALGTRRKVLPVRNVRAVTKRDMVRNAYNPDIHVDLRSKRVLIDGKVVTSAAVAEVPLNRLCLLA